jgi:hypothetical protein
MKAEGEHGTPLFCDRALGDIDSQCNERLDRSERDFCGFLGVLLSHVALKKTLHLFPQTLPYMVFVPH